MKYALLAVSLLLVACKEDRQPIYGRLVYPDGGMSYVNKYENLKECSKWAKSWNPQGREVAECTMNDENGLYIWKPYSFDVLPAGLNVVPTGPTYTMDLPRKTHIISTTYPVEIRGPLKCTRIEYIKTICKPVK